MARLYYGTSESVAEHIMQSGFDFKQTGELLFTILPDAAALYGSIIADERQEDAYGVIQVQYEGYEQVSPNYRRQEEHLVPAENLARMTVQMCVIYNAENGTLVRAIVSES